jgi:hypothetical protein
MFMDKTIDGLLFVQGEETTFVIEPHEDGISITEAPEGEPVAIFATIDEALAAYDDVPLGCTVFDFRKKLQEYANGTG